jgi:phenylpropionate dioxygenase-like ring-hydroxylating dioxygenase large terminal subunit
MGARPPAPDRTGEELRRFAQEMPIAAAATPPKSWYVDPAFLELERAKVFARSWQYACPLDLVRKPGDYARVDLLGESYVVVRNARGELRGFHNVCRHHAAELLAGNGCVQSIVCPYHGWTYDLDGRLESAPRMGAMQGFTREGFSLPAVHVEAWGPFVFLHAGSPQRALRDELAQLVERLEGFGMEGLRYVTRRSYPMQCNWKVFVDNYLDGGYHIAHLHHGLASQLDLHGYTTECFERFSIQTCPGGEQATFRGQDFRERIGKGALYAWLYPNFMLNRYGPILDINWVRPLAADRCEVVFDYWYPEGSGADGRAFVDASLAASDAVQQEDVAISESVQRGLGSSSYDQGRYAPNVELAMHHFHRLLATDLGAE